MGVRLSEIRISHFAIRLKKYKVLSVLCLLCYSAGASVINMNVVSDSSWKSNNTYVDGWNTVEFKADEFWSDARQDYPLPEDITPDTFIPGTTAKCIWHDPSVSSNGTSGSNEAYFRYSFDLDLASASNNYIGYAFISVDDDYEFYVNGVKAFQNKDGGNAEIVDLVNFTSRLRNGKNVFAIHAVDGSWDDPRNRTYERLLFDGRIVAVPPNPHLVPETNTSTLFVIGLLALLPVIWRPIKRYHN